MSLLTLDQANVWFGGVKAVAGVSLELEEGRLYGLVGPNGSGKTTLLNTISRVGPLTSGAISFGGRGIAGAPPDAVARMGMARTFQSIRLIRTLTVRENILLGADHIGDLDEPGGLFSRGRRRERQAQERADEAIERLALQRVASAMPSNLPYGTQRRVEIARAVSSRPRLLLLDEPVAGMNRDEREEISAVIMELRDSGLTQLLIEHDLRMIQRLCDHLFVMNFGKCVADGPPRETAALPVVQEAYLGKRVAGTER